MATTIEQQVALDEALVPSNKRLRIGRSNFRLPSDIKSKESTLQVVYDVLRQSPFFKAFLVTADVPEICMQELWATAYVHQHSIRFKMDAKKKLSIWKRFGRCCISVLGFRANLLLSYRLKRRSWTRATRPTDPSDVERTEAEQLKIVLKRSRQETHISQQGGSSTDEGTESGEDNNEETKSDGESEEEETREEEISEEERIQEEEKADELYRDVDINQRRGLQVSQDIEDYHVTLTTIQPDGQQESSSVSSFVTSMLNPTSDAGVESIFMTASSPIAPLPTTTPIMTPSTIATITTSSDAPIPPTTIPSTVKSQVKEQVSRIFPRIEESVNAQLEAEVLTRSSNSSRTSYAVVADLTEMELKKILFEKMEGNKSIQRSDEQRNLYKDLVDAYEADKTILESYGDTAILKRRRGDDDDQEGPSAGLDRGSKRRREGGEHESASTPSEPATRSASRSTIGTQSKQMSASAEDQPIVQTSQHPEWFSQPRKPPTPDRDWNKTLPAIQGNAQTWISNLAKQADSRSSFNELLDTPIDFSNFIMNRLCVDTLTPELLAGPTFELMRGSCTSLTELEYHLEEVYKATTDQLDWVNPEGQQYPHNLLQPLSLIPDNRGRRVIPFEHFINNDLEYLQGGASSQKYTTSVTKTKAADYGHIKWIEDLVPRTMWIQEPLNYDKHALWGVSHWGRKRQQFYGFAVNRESALNETLKKRWRYLVPAESHIHNCMLIPNYHDIKYQDFRHSDGLSKLGRYEHVSPMLLEHKGRQMRKGNVTLIARVKIHVHTLCFFYKLFSVNPLMLGFGGEECGKCECDGEGLSTDEVQGGGVAT
nr:hypothetical protein [Tanacetum cinerariifolium]